MRSSGAFTDVPQSALSGSQYYRPAVLVTANLDNRDNPYGYSPGLGRPESFTASGSFQTTPALKVTEVIEVTNN